MNLPDLITRPVFLFDLFHTLSTIRHARVEGPETHELLGVSREVYVAALFGDSDLRLRGTLRDHVEIVADIARAAGSTVPAGRYPQIAQARAGRFAESLRRVAPHVLETLDALRTAGKRLALISNADVLEAAGWPDSPLAARFDHAIFSCDVGLVKPEPAIYALALERLGARPEDAVFVGDGGSNEFAGARAAGVPTICTTEFIRDIWPERVAARVAEADCSIARITELAGDGG